MGIFSFGKSNEDKKDGLLDEIDDEPTSSAREKLITARVRLQKEHPFFSYLTMGLNLIEVKDNKSMPTAAVDNFGNLYYNPDFVETLDKEGVKTLLSHESLHVALLHLNRLNSRNPMAWNVATDILINNMLTLNGFKFNGLMKQSILPKDNKYKIGGVTIDKLDKRFAEEIYDIIEKLIKEKKISMSQSNGATEYKDGEGTYKQFDVHKHGKPKDKETKEEREGREKAEREWKKRMSEAYNYAKNQGREPLGADRQIEGLLDSKLNWKEILYKFVTNEIPYDYTYRYPSKRSIATGYYMPSIMKDQTIEVTIAVDTSGSVGQEELGEFLTEVYAIGTAFHQVKINLLFWDAALQNHYKLDNTELDELLKYKINGGGGTVFTGIPKYISNNIPSTKVLILLTDGYADFWGDNPSFKTLIILSKNSVEVQRVEQYGEVIKIE